MALIYLSGAWLAGIFLGSKFDLPVALILTGLLPLPLLFLFRQRRKLIILAAACLIAFFGGALCYQASLPPDDSSHIKFHNGGEVTIEGTVSADPEVRDNCTHLRLSVSRINPENEDWQEVSGEVLLFVHRYPEYHYGDVLRVTGKLEEPAQLDDFDYKDYLERQGIYATMLYPEIERLHTGQGFKPLEWVYGLRNSLAESIAQVMPEPQASLTQGVLLGIRYTIPSEIKDAFVSTGTTHILVISGVNLTIIAGMLVFIGKRLFGKLHYIYVWLALSMTWLYGFISGAYLPVLRAAIMVSVFLIAELLGKQCTAVPPRAINPLAITSIAFAAAIMVAIDPQILWDASFQLSFLAMAGLIFLAPSLMELGGKAVKATVGETGVVASIANFTADSLAVTLAATIAVWPLIAHYFGIVSLVGPLATFLALPALPAIIVLGAAAGLAGLVFVPIAQAIGWIAWLFASYLLLIVNGFAALPLSSVEVSPVSATAIVIYYSLLTAIVWLGSRRGWGKLKIWLEAMMNTLSRLPWKWVIVPLLVLAILTSVAAASLPDDKLRVSFLDIGQGDAILIQQGNQQVLIDGGPSPQLLTGELGERMPFWDRTIELVVLTHPHDDHLAGLVEVLKRYDVEQVFYPDLEYDSSLYAEWLELIDAQDIPCTLAQAGQEIELGEGVMMAVLNPQTPQLTGTEIDIDTDVENNGSLVLRLSLGQVSFLLTADIMWEAEFKLIAERDDLASTVLKVAHHGSNTSTTADFLEAVSPQLAVISVGKDNPYGHPGEEVIERLAASLGAENIFRTDEQGTIEFTTDGERLWVTAEKD